jgi:hypothetical protein
MTRMVARELTEDDVINICSELDPERILTVTEERDSQHRLTRLEFVLDSVEAHDCFMQQTRRFSDG